MRKPSPLSISLATGAALLILPLLLISRLHWLRPPRVNTQRPLFRGIDYQRIVRNLPRPLMIHIVTIDLNQARIKPILTPPAIPSSDYTTARTTSQFLKDFNLKLAINASYFQPFHENTPWDYYPKSGDRVFPLGQTIVNNQVYRPAAPGWHVFCFTADRRAQIPGHEKCPQQTIHGVAGSQVLVLNGQVKLNPDPRENKPYPRVAVGIDKTGKKISLVVVDGKQPLYSEGVTSNELAKIMLELPTHTALHLDGGGSATLAISTPVGIKVLNSPIHTKIPTHERPVANHLGFSAEAL